MSKPLARSIASLVGLAALTYGAGFLSAAPSRGSKTWYRRLHKPAFTPPDSAFAPVWTALYGLSTLGAWRMLRAPASKERSRALGWWAVQLASNTAYTPLFFGQHRKKSGLAASALSALATQRFIRNAKRVDRGAAWLLVPQLVWVSFASVLMEEIVRRNR